MVSKAIVNVVCDVHLTKGEEVPAVFSEVVSVGAVRRMLELCEECRLEIIGNLVAVLEKFGTRTGFTERRGPALRTPEPEPEKKRRRPGQPKKCRFCEQEFKGGAGAAAHERVTHPQELADLQAREQQDQPDLIQPEQELIQA